MTVDEAHAEFQRIVSLDDIGEAGVEKEIEASASERSALAARFGLLSLDALDARLRLERMHAPPGAIRVAGRVRGRAVQACAATLKPVPQAVDEAVAVFYAPATEEGSSGEITVEADGAPPFEPLPADVIDLGELAAQHFALALDPYPRHRDAPCGPLRFATDGESGNRPFAALGQLKGKL